MMSDALYHWLEMLETIILLMKRELFTTGKLIVQLNSKSKKKIKRSLKDM